MIMTRENEILQYLHYNPGVSRSEIETGMNLKESPATVKRILAGLVESGQAVVIGQGRATRYSVSAQAHVTMPLNIDTYFEKETDERIVQTDFNFELINDILPKVELFTPQEKEQLDPPGDSVVDADYAWYQPKGDSVIMGIHQRSYMANLDYAGAPKQGGKQPVDYILEEPEHLKELTIRRIEELHTLLVKELDVDKGIRRRRVGVTGTNYRPLDNEFQIREALEDSCRLINRKESVFEKALLALVLISYIQAFSDGNKRTARMTSNAILIANRYCPISFRTVDSVDYKKAMLIFYEQNNISAFKKIFIDQFAFAVGTYF